MSDPILPLLEWPSGIQQASVPANENALRNEALSMPALGVANDEISPIDGDIWIVGDTPAGAFAEFDENDIALFRDGWHAWAPVEGVRLVVNDVRKVYAGTGGWIDDPSITGGGGGGGMSRAYTIVTEASAFTATVGTHDGLDTYTRAGGNVTFNSSQPYVAGMTFPIRATGAVTLVGTGVTLTAPSGGTLAMTADMAVQVVMTSATTADVIGQTVAV